MRIVFTIIQWLLILLLVFVVRLLTLSIADISWEMDYPVAPHYYLDQKETQDI